MASHRSVAAFFSTLICLAAASFGSARAETVTLSAVDSGWYRASGHHLEGNRNYIVGYEYDCRNYFVFDLSGVTGTLTRAVLGLNTHSVVIPDSLTYTLFDVETPVAELGRSTDGAAIHADLGEGESYGSRVYTAADEGAFRTIELSEAFLRDANAAAGGMIAIGGAAAGPTMGGFLFGWSCGAPGDVQLTLTYQPGIASAAEAVVVPLPSSAWGALALMLVLAGGGLLQRRRRVAGMVMHG